ncbi:MAG: hypothetical protein M1343_03050 [Chloroflexi bacterium]|nr:hypothetical protein [Chloroflexota bacterium]MDA8187141.1 hypothetical protein [Dehalococcoidales bacterium]
MGEINFERQYRTPYSEGYLMLEDKDRLGKVDIHYTPTVVYATLVIEKELDEDDVLDLIEKVDDDIVLTADVPRDDFIVSVYHGRDMGTYSDEYFEEEGEEEE